jgi:surface polysaccharide O-acyltransferase-like enzyme
MHVNVVTRAGAETWWPGGLAGVPLFCTAVPTFMLVSGFLQANASAPPRWRLARLLLPMLTWGVVMQFIVVDRAGSPAWRRAYELTTGEMHLYFLAALAQLYLCSLGLRRRTGSYRINVRVLAVAGACSVLCYAVGDFLLWSRVAGTFAIEGEWRKLLFPWAIFYFFGLRAGGCDGWFRWSQPRIGRLLVLSAAFYVVYVCGLMLQEKTFAYTPRIQIFLMGLPFQFCAAWLVLLLARRWEDSCVLRSWFASLAKRGGDVYAIYLAHVPVLVTLVSGASLLGIPSGSWLDVPLFWLATLIVTALWVRLARRFCPGWLQLFVLGEIPAVVSSGRPA